MMLIFGYFLSSFFYLINYEKWGVDISLNTIYIIVLSILIFLIIEVFTMNIIGHKSLKSKWDLKYIRVSADKNIIVFLINIVSIVSLGYFISSVTGISIFNISDMLSRYKEMVLEDGLDFNFIVNIFVKTTYAFSYIYLYIFINNIVKEKSIKREIKNMLPIFAGIILTLLLSNRLTLISYLIFFLVALSLIKNRYYGNQYKPKIKNYLTMLLAIIVFFYIFYLLTDFIGRDNSFAFVDYISIYAGSSIPNLDSYFGSANTSITYIYPFQEILPGLINSLSNLGLLSERVTKTLEFRIIGNNLISNVYTGLRRMYSSGGILGIIIFQSVFSLIISTFYYKIKKNSYNHYWFGLMLIIFCKVIFTVPLQAIEDQFFINVISIGYILETLILIVSYFFITRFKVVSNTIE